MLLNLGREDKLDRQGLVRLVASINRYNRYLGEPEPRLPASLADAAELVGLTRWVCARRRR